MTERSFSLDVANGHVVSMIASGLNPKCCYYRGPYDGGALFFLVLDVPADVVGPVPAERAVTVMTEVISAFEIDHREMAQSFLKTQGFAVEAEDDFLAASRGNDSLRVSFDSLQRIDNIEGTLKPS